MENNCDILVAIMTDTLTNPDLMLAIKSVEVAGLPHQVFVCGNIKDFAKERNRILEEVRAKFVFFLDSDERLVIKNKNAFKVFIRNLGFVRDDILGFGVEILSPTVQKNGQIFVTTNNLVRIVRRDPRIRFEGRAHETVYPSIIKAGGKINKFLTQYSFYIAHIGYSRSYDLNLQKIKRNNDKLLSYLPPNIGSIFYYLGTSYIYTGEKQRGISYLCVAKDFLGKSDMLDLVEKILNEYGKEKDN